MTEVEAVAASAERLLGVPLARQGDGVLKIALAGPAGSGKSTVAQALAAVGFRRESLGEVARRACLARGWPVDRRHLQEAGDALRAGHGDNPSGPAALARTAVLRLEFAASMEGAWRTDCRAGWVLDGVRLPAEADWLRARGWAVVLLDVPEERRAARVMARDGAPVPDHHTERGWTGIRADVRLQGGAVGAAGLVSRCKAALAARGVAVGERGGPEIGA